MLLSLRIFLLLLNMAVSSQERDEMRHIGEQAAARDRCWVPFTRNGDVDTSRNEHLGKKHFLVTKTEITFSGSSPIIVHREEKRFRFSDFESAAISVSVSLETSIKAASGLGLADKFVLLFSLLIPFLNTLRPCHDCTPSRLPSDRFIRTPLTISDNQHKRPFARLRSLFFRRTPQSQGLI